MTTNTINSRYRRFLTLICLSIVIVLFLAGLWPLNFYPENGITRSKDEGGIRFGGFGMAYCPEPLFGPRQPLKESAPLVIELAVRPLTELDCHVARILSFHDDQGKESFFIGQWKSNLILRSRSPQTGSRNPTVEIGAGKTLTILSTRFITVVSGKEGTSIYVDGKNIRSSPRFSLPPKGSDRPLYLLLGDAPGGREDWTGDLFELSIFDRTMSGDEIMMRFTDWTKHVPRSVSPAKDAPFISYRFDERSGNVARNQGDPKYNLVVPPTFRVMYKTVLALPWKGFVFSRSLVKDVAVNILGFIPAGFFFLAWFRDRKLPSAFPAATLSIILGGLISLAIELTQVYLPTRDSSAKDLACNILGTVIGVVAYAQLSRSSIKNRFPGWVP